MLPSAVPFFPCHTNPLQMDVVVIASKHNGSVVGRKGRRMDRGKIELSSKHSRLDSLVYLDMQCDEILFSWWYKRPYKRSADKFAQYSSHPFKMQVCLVAWRETFIENQTMNWFVRQAGNQTFWTRQQLQISKLQPENCEQTLLPGLGRANISRYIGSPYIVKLIIMSLVLLIQKGAKQRESTSLAWKLSSIILISHSKESAKQEEKCVSQMAIRSFGHLPQGGVENYQELIPLGTCRLHTH